MTEHPRELLARFDRLPADDPERKRVAAHLEECPACRRVVTAFREIDQVLDAPPNDLPPFQAISRRLIGTARRMRRAFVTILALAAAQFLVGIAALVVLADSALAAGLGAGVFLANSALLVGIAFINRRNAGKYEDVAGDWNRGRLAWWTHLTGEARASLVAGVSSAVVLGCGLPVLIFGVARSVPLQTASGLLLVAVGVMGVVVHPRRRRRARRELQALDELFSPDSAA